METTFRHPAVLYAQSAAAWPGPVPLWDQRKTYALSSGPGTVSALAPKSADAITGILLSFAYAATASPTALLTMPLSTWTPSRSTSFLALVSPTSGLPRSEEHTSELQS